MLHKAAGPHLHPHRVHQPKRRYAARYWKSDLSEPEITKKLELLCIAIRARDGVRVKVVLLISEVSREQMPYACILVHNTTTASGLHPITKAAYAAKRGQVVSLTVHDYDGRHARSNVLNGVQ